MNKQQRHDLDVMVQTLDQMRTDIEEMKQGAQDEFDDMPETAQESDRGQRLESRIEALEVAFEKVDAAMDAVQEAAEEPS